MKRFENYPFWIVLISNFLSIAIYGLGFFIMVQLHWVVAVAYLLYVLALEVRLIKNHCTNCYYWGKTCGFGRGRLSVWLFKQGDATKFCNLEITWKTMIPDFLVWTVPVTVAIILLIIKFSVLILVTLLLLIVFSSVGNAFVRGSLTCKHCKQMEIGCPADKLFNE